MPDRAPSPTRVTLAGTWLLLILAGRLESQIPQTFTNLKVLPADIPRRQLIDAMRTVALNLGVRCDYCHPGGNPETLEGVDFATDSLGTKRVARRMMEMVRSVNQTVLAEVAPDSTKRIALTCFTCHRGVSRPEPLERIVARAATDRGLDSAVAEYRRLRGTYYGQASYDFGERTLVVAADLLRTGSRYPEALGVLQLNLEFYPQSAETFATLGVTHAAAGDTARAIASFRSALALVPDNPFLLQQLTRLGATP